MKCHLIYEIDTCYINFITRKILGMKRECASSNWNGKNNVKKVIKGNGLIKHLF